MKKLLFFIVFIIYSLSSFGVSLNYFYCCGKLKQVSVALKHKGGECNGFKGKDCCKNKIVQLKISDEQQHQPIVALGIEKLFPVGVLQATFSPQAIIGLIDTSSFISHSPPLLSHTSLSILFGVFRI
jgi:hypothetical protein